MSTIAWLSVSFSLCYIFLAIKNDSRCFYFGIISSLLWSYESFFVYALKFDAALQIFYVMMSIYGLYQWKYGGHDKSEKPISKLSNANHIKSILAGFAVSLLFIFLSRYFAEIARPIIDAVTTVFFVVGTLLLVERKLYSWIYLVVCDIAMIYVYLSTEAWLFAGMMGLYTVLGTFGYIQWRRLLSQNI